MAGRCLFLRAGAGVVAEHKQVAGCEKCIPMRDVEVGVYDKKYTHILSR